METTQKVFIGTFMELESKLNELLKNGIIIKDVKRISDLTEVSSFVNDNFVRCFIIITKSKNG